MCMSYKTKYFIRETVYSCLVNNISIGIENKAVIGSTENLRYIKKF